MVGMSIWRSYFEVAKPPKPDDVSPGLWNDDALIHDYYLKDDKYQTAVMEQYKLYVEHCDRISARRGLANTFFLTLNSAIFTLIGLFWKDRPEDVTPWIIVPPLIIAIGLCLAWFWLVRSYRQLNSAKFAVVGALESRLPASPWWNGEWKALGGQELDKSRYWAVTHIETWVPALFATTYILGAIAIVWSGR